MGLLPTTLQPLFIALTYSLLANTSEPFSIHDVTFPGIGLSHPLQPLCSAPPSPRQSAHHVSMSFLRLRAALSALSRTTVPGVASNSSSPTEAAPASFSTAASSSSPQPPFLSLHNLQFGGGREGYLVADLFKNSIFSENIYL